MADDFGDVCLPRFEEITDLFMERFEFLLRQETRSDGFLGELKAHAIHEGKSSTIVRSDEDIDEMVLKTGSAEINVDNRDAESIDVDKIRRYIAIIAEQFRKDQSEMVFSALDDVSNRTGNVVRGDGRPLDHEGLFEALEKVQHNFSRGPGQTDLMLVVGTGMAERLKVLDAEFRNSPELQRRFSEIMMRKYEQYRDREMDRTLAG